MLWEECRRSNEKWISTIIKEEKLNVNVAKTGYVGLSIATLLAQHRHVTVVDIIEDKVNFINNKKSHEYIEKYLAEKELDLTATLNALSVVLNSDFNSFSKPSLQVTL